ncbi:hypothetical protein ACJMK2_007890 [Sinanodonta woodiana]|uniref:ADP-ribosylation factor-related protein 1 n=1 Tax=Sinanodonta woodiana TaxID=1069815 RepID=A0ABD3VJV6_SINWO
MENHVLFWIDVVRDGIKSGDLTIIGLLSAIIVVLITVVFFAFIRRGNKRSGVLILGTCDAGKTLLFSRLVNKVYKQSYTSIAPNTGDYNIPNTNKTLRIIDLPGHERLRLQNLSSYKDLARAIIFVVDSSAIQKEVKEVAEYLYTLLSDNAISTNCPPFLIACNKQDLTLAKGLKVIQSQLEKEMNTLRVTRSAALQGQDGAGNNNTFLGKRNKDFAFSDLKPLKVDFAECSAQGNDEKSDPDIKCIEEWLLKVA